MRCRKMGLFESLQWVFKTPRIIKSLPDVEYTDNPTLDKNWVGELVIVPTVLGRFAKGVVTRRTPVVPGDQHFYDFALIKYKDTTDA